MGKTSREMSYTRQKYISSIPQSKIKKFTVGNPHSEAEHRVSLIASTNVEVSSKALEAARVTANRALARLLGERSFLLKVVPYPHEIVREHKFMGFAGADRLSRGMKLAFGRPTGRAARVNAGQEVLTVSVGEGDINAAKEALERASKKLPLRYTIDVERSLNDPEHV